MLAFIDRSALASALHDAYRNLQYDARLVYAVSDVSAETLPELNSAATSPLVISALHSDKTIFGTPALNWLQRAHHDSLHLALQADTSAGGEERVAYAQCAAIERYAGTTLARWLWADTYGQGLHLQQYGAFPHDQVGFVAHYMATGEVLRF